jgi:alkanesulfonate monooxygenase SsuD/methylene tetrahydromethanopterin reductase-like flavin-dependent oxidoreductase (luciferase family)
MDFTLNGRPVSVAVQPGVVAAETRAAAREKVMTWPAGPEEIRKAMRLVPGDAGQSVSASGSPEECKAKVRHYVANGATCPILYPLGDDVGLMLETFAGGDLS